MINKVINTHFAFIGGFSLDKSGCNITICCVIDNLLKGAATQAIQNLNSSYDLEELTGINND
jgi:N-acetyl-gamma-glutamylphosphate reductase